MEQPITTIDISKIILPPPLKLNVQPVESTETIPGNIIIDEHGKLMKAWIEYEGHVGAFIEQYDTWVKTILPKQVASRTLVLANNAGTVEFENTLLVAPSISTASNQTRQMTPQQARLEGLSYSASLYVDAVHKLDGKVIERKQKIFQGKIPVMLGSSLCILHEKTTEEKVALGEDANDPLGYYVIRGSERVVITQEKLRMGRLGVHLDNGKTSKNRPKATITCPAITGSSIINIKVGKQHTLKLHLRLFGKSSVKTIPVLGIFKLFGLTNPSDILKRIVQFMPAKYIKKLGLHLNMSFLKLERVDDMVEYIIRKWDVKDEPIEGVEDLYQRKKMRVLAELEKELFPHMREEPFSARLDLLAIMIVRLLEYMAGVRDLDDRDDWGEKRGESSPRSCEQLFTGLWKKVTDLGQITINDKKITTLSAAVKAMPTNVITDEFSSSFTTAYWGVKPYKSVSYLRENVSEVLKRESIVSTLAQLRKVNTPTNRKVKKSKIRYVQNSQLGYLCPVATPEGENCGLVKFLTLMCYLSVERPEAPVRTWLETMGIITRTQTDRTTYKLIFNGKFLGWCNGLELEKAGKQARRDGVLYKDMCIVAEESFLYVYCDGARPTRPLLIVDEDQHLVIDKKGLWGANFDTLLKEGCVEYIDAWEQHYISLAQTASDVRNRPNQLREAVATVASLQSALKRVKAGEVVVRNFKDDDGNIMQYEATKDDIENELNQTTEALAKMLKRKKYTHCELDPQGILDVTASIIPLPNHNQAPRNVYQSSMAKQAMGVYHSNHLNRFDSLARVLSFPNRPIFEPQMNQHIGLNEFPSGQNVMLAILADPYNQEDAFVFKKEAIERGLFMYTKYTAYKTTLKSTKTFRDKFIRPTAKKNESASKYSHIQENGVPIVGAVLRPGDCVIGKERHYYETGETDNVSQFMSVGEYGVVDKVFEGYNEDNEKFIHVKIRSVVKQNVSEKDKQWFNIKPHNADKYIPKARQPVIGDKFACLGSDHDVLTATRGWIPISDLLLTDLVATLNPITGCLEYQQPTHLHAYDFDGDMYHIKNQQIDLMVTPNHYMYICPRDQNLYRLKRADEIFGKRVEYLKNANSELKDIDKFIIPGIHHRKDFNKDLVVPMDSWITLFGIWIAEGWCCEGQSNIGIAANKQRVKDALRSVVPDMGLKLSECKYDKFNISHPQLANYFRPLSVGAINKRLPEWCFNLSARQSKLLIEAMMLGDGYKIKGGGSYHYYTSSKGLADDMQRLALHAGWSANMWVRFEAGHTTTKKDGTHIITNADAHVVSINRTKNSPQVNHGHVHQQKIQTEEWVPYTGKVYCCTVPNHIIYVRRNGLPVWTGNSRHAQKGTYGLSRPTSDMPFIGSGVSIDILDQRRKEREARAELIAQRELDRNARAKKFAKKKKLSEEDIKQQEIDRQETLTAEKIRALDLQQATEDEVLRTRLKNRRVHMDGIVPDLIINPHSIPSRMTMGKMIEILASKVGVVTAQRQDATAFRNVSANVDDLGRVLEENGFEYGGTEILYNGTTGKRLTAKVYVGTCYYQALRHTVLDKYQARDRGARTKDTRQPTGGRAIEGGLRIGEMERDAIISHGASQLLLERLCYVSDAFTMPYCRHCGTMSNTSHTNEQTACRYCATRGDFGQWTGPYAYKLVTDILIGAGFNIKFDMVLQSEAKRSMVIQNEAREAAREAELLEAAEEEEEREEFDYGDLEDEMIVDE